MALASETQGARKRKGPSPNIGLQQRIPLKQLVYTPKCVTLTLIVFGVICITVGIICVAIEATVTAWPTSGPYTYFGGNEMRCPCTENDLPNDYCMGQARGKVAPCLVQFNITEDMSGPIYFYYTLTNFYQNNQRVVKSHSPAMSRGEGLVESAESGYGFPECVPEESYTSNKAGTDVEIYYYPCGLMSRSLFNDTFTLKKRGTGEKIAWTSKGIAYASSGGINGRNQVMSVEWHRDNCYRLGGQDFDQSGYHEDLRAFSLEGNPNGRFDCWHNVSEEGYQVWTRPAARPSFWKLHKNLKEGLKKGQYDLEIVLNFPVANFSGTKGFYFTNATPMGYVCMYKCVCVNCICMYVYIGV